MEIVPGLHQLKTPMAAPALPYMLPYAFVGKDGVSLFDAGFGTPEATASMTAQLKVLGFEPKDIRRLIISHAHPDHIGMAGWVKEQAPDSDLVMMGREWQWIQDRWHNNNAWTQLSDGWLVRHGVPQDEVDAAQAAGALSPNSPTVKPGDALPPPDQRAAPSVSRNPVPDVKPTVLLEDGDVLEFDEWRLQAVWTPGHTPGHLCMFELNHRLMFTGDHVLPYISPNVSLHADQEGTSPLSDFRESLKKVASFNAALGLPAHEFTIADLTRRCEVLLHHHDDRLEEVRNAIGEGMASARDISQRVKWNTGPFDDFNIFMKRSALGETLSHLKLLEDNERVKSINDGDRVMWAPIA